MPGLEVYAGHADRASAAPVQQHRLYRSSPRCTGRFRNLHNSLRTQAPAQSVGEALWRFLNILLLGFTGFVVQYEQVSFNVSKGEIVLTIT